MIYFIQVGQGGPIKIGTAVDVVKRFSGIQTHHHEILILRAVMDGGADVEAELHRRFVRHIIRGEWFKPHADLLAFIDGLGMPPIEIADACVTPELYPSYLVRVKRSDGSYDTFDSRGWVGDIPKSAASGKAKAAARKRWDREDRAPRSGVREAEAVWRDTVNYRTNPEALGAPGMAGWTLREAYRAFGPRWPQRPGGRPRKKA